MSAIPAPGRRRSLEVSLRGLRDWPALPAVVALVVFLAVYVAINPELFSRFQLQTVANQIAPLTLIAFGQLLIVVVGGIDISIAGITSLANVVFVSLLDSDLVPLALLGAAGIGIAAGLLNGALSTIGRLPTIAVTLATAFIYSALAVEVMDRPGGTVPLDFVQITSGELVPYVPIGFFWIALAATLLWVLLNRTVIGRRIYGAGGNPEGLRASGANPDFARLVAFGLGGLLVAGGAILLAGATSTGDPRSGDPYLLTSIAAVALGGADFRGGAGSVVGTACAAAVLALIGNFLFFAGINSYWQYVIGSMVIIAVVGVPAIVRAVATRYRTTAHR